MAFQKGDVVLVPLPFTDLRAAKVRPAVILSSSTYHATEPDLILGAITSNLAAATAPVDTCFPSASHLPLPHFSPSFRVVHVAPTVRLRL